MAWRTTADKRSQFVTLRLTESEASDLDALAEHSQISRSELIRRALHRLCGTPKAKVLIKQQKKQSKNLIKSKSSDDE